MKKIAITIIIIGLLLTVFTGFRFFTKKEVVDMGKFKITRSDSHRVKWPPYVGVGIMLVGGIMLFAGAKKGA